VNLPAYRLDVYENGALLQTYPIAIGKTTHRTPRGEFEISHIDWNPWWHPPNSPWARGARPTPPGPRNPMGRAKLYFEGLYYIHGSPAEYSLGSAASHGCLRMANADVIELARLVHSYGTPGLPDSELNRVVSNPRSPRRITLPRPVALDLVYEVAEVREGKLELHPDVYGIAGGAKREQAIQALLMLGYAQEEIDQGRLDQLIGDSGRRSVSVPVESVLRHG
jgi:murein L,D-transpeptidase YcbB/YkuD